jgi:outer membrane receptor protein involved in Fe transport
MNVPEARFSALSFEGRWQIRPWIGVRGSISWLDPENTSDADAVPVIADFGAPVSYTLTTQRIPYLPCRTAAATIDVKPDRATTISTSFQHQGAMVIQYFDRNNLQPDALYSETQPWLIPTPSFWTMNVRVGRTFKDGFDAYLGVDNVTDYVQTDLGNPAVDHDWGPLRGRYVYAGVGYRYGR